MMVGVPQILVMVRRIRRTFCTPSWIAVFLSCLSLFLLVWIVHLYFHQKLLHTEAILTVLGRDRNTSASVLPGVDTVIMEPTHGCVFEGKDTQAIIMVPSLPERRDRRENIRQTWGRSRYLNKIMVYFVVGKVKSGDYAELRAEASLHGDIIVENIDDNYYGLTTKTLRMLKWFDKNCPSSPYFIKADDDVFVNISALVQILATLPESFQIGGRVLLGRTPNLRNPFTKWYTPPELWDSKAVAPPYIGGPFYVIKGSFAPKLLEASYRVPLYHLEDVFISGMVASQQLNARLYELPGSRDPKFPWISYLLEYHFGWESVDKSIVSFHTDGDMRLMRRIYEDVEIAQIYT